MRAISYWRVTRRLFKGWNIAAIFRSGYLVSLLMLIALALSATCVPSDLSGYPKLAVIIIVCYRRRRLTGWAGLASAPITGQKYPLQWRRRKLLLSDSSNKCRSRIPHPAVWQVQRTGELSSSLAHWATVSLAQWLTPEPGDTVLPWWDPRAGDLRKGTWRHVHIMGSWVSDYSSSGLSFKFEYSINTAHNSQDTSIYIINNIHVYVDWYHVFWDTNHRSVLHN